MICFSDLTINKIFDSDLNFVAKSLYENMTAEITTNIYISWPRGFTLRLNTKDEQ